MVARNQTKASQHPILRKENWAQKLKEALQKEDEECLTDLQQNKDGIFYKNEKLYVPCLLRENP